jgi:opacity protein-like surface antigen
MLALAGATAFLNTATYAADFPRAMPQPLQQLVTAPPPIDTSGWYLRGDIGVAKQSYKTFDHVPTNDAFVWPASWRIDQNDMSDAMFAGIGMGYAWSSWLRVDITGEYRAKAKLKVLGSYTEFCPGGRCFDLYDANQQAWVFMANAYLDLGTWWCLTPFVGVGVGTAYTTVSGMHDVGFISDGTTGFGYAKTDFSKWNFAWAFHAGLAYNVSNSFKVEFAYRYLDLGTIQTPVVDCASSGCTGSGPRAYYNLTSFTSHDFKIGMRWMLQPDQVAPPVYAPPPLMRRG